MHIKTDNEKCPKCNKELVYQAIDGRQVGPKYCESCEYSDYLESCHYRENNCWKNCASSGICVMAGLLDQPEQTSNNMEAVEYELKRFIK